MHNRTDADEGSWRLRLGGGRFGWRIRDLGFCFLGEWRPARTYSGDARATSDEEISSYGAVEG
jgi:hypothetical protein